MLLQCKMMQRLFRLKCSNKMLNFNEKLKNIWVCVCACGHESVCAWEWVCVRVRACECVSACRDFQEHPPARVKVQKPLSNSSAYFSPLFSFLSSFRLNYFSQLFSLRWHRVHKVCALTFLSEKAIKFTWDVTRIFIRQRGENLILISW